MQAVLFLTVCVVTVALFSNVAQSESVYVSPNPVLVSESIAQHVIDVSAARDNLVSNTTAISVKNVTSTVIENVVSTIWTWVGNLGGERSIGDEQSQSWEVEQGERARDRLVEAVVAEPLLPCRESETAVDCWCRRRAFAWPCSTFCRRYLSFPRCSFSPITVSGFDTDTIVLE